MLKAFQCARCYVLNLNLQMSRLCNGRRRRRRTCSEAWWSNVMPVCVAANLGLQHRRYCCCCGCGCCGGGDGGTSLCMKTRKRALLICTHTPSHTHTRSMTVIMMMMNHVTDIRVVGCWRPCRRQLTSKWRRNRAASAAAPCRHRHHHRRRSAGTPMTLKRLPRSNCSAAWNRWHAVRKPAQKTGAISDTYFLFLLRCSARCRNRLSQLPDAANLALWPKQTSLQTQATRDNTSPDVAEAR